MQTALKDVARLHAEKVQPSSAHLPPLHRDSPVLVMLAAGKGTRFGASPKCIQPVGGTPLARHTLNAFRQLSTAPSICLVGYEAQQVAAHLGEGNLFVHTADPAGGTALAAMEAFSVSQPRSR